MEQRVSLITLGVADLEASTKFYERLGWVRSVSKSRGVAFFQTGDSALALYPRQALADDLGVALEPPGFRAMTLAHNVHSREEVDRLLAEAAKAARRY